ATSGPGARFSESPLPARLERRRRTLCRLADGRRSNRFGWRRVCTCTRRRRCSEERPPVKAVTAALVLVVALGGLTACGSAAGPPASAPSELDPTDGPAVVIPTPSPEPVTLTAGKAEVGGTEADGVR